MTDNDQLTTSTETGTETESLRGLSRIRYAALIAVAGLSITTLATFGIALIKTYELVEAVFNSRSREELLIVFVLESIDIYLLAIVQLIVLIGLYELFIGDLDVPMWLEASSLEDLKKPIVDVLVVFMAVKGIEKFITASSPADALTYVGAVAAFIVSLAAYRAFGASRVTTKAPTS